MKKSLILISLALVVLSCKPETPGTDVEDTVDRQAILTNWADQIIIPEYTEFTSKAEVLSSASLVFQASPTLSTLDALRQAWEEAYLDWQSVSMFEVGPADAVGLRNNLNIYPVNVEEVNENISEGGYNLALPSLVDAQGFPALDYLLYGLGSHPEEILEFFTSDEHAAERLQYVVDLTARISSLAETVLSSWTNNYRDEFITNDGSDANASLDQTVNALLFYYEKFLRAGKIGIPAGVFSGTALPDLVEARYAENISTELLLASLDAYQAFFNGKRAGISTNGPSLGTYLDELDSKDGDQLLSGAINQQFDLARTAINSLDDSLYANINDDLPSVLRVYDELQKNVVLLKVDMMQALSVNVSYVDADGD